MEKQKKEVREEQDNDRIWLGIGIAAGIIAVLILLCYLISGAAW